MRCETYVILHHVTTGKDQRVHKNRSPKRQLGLASPTATDSTIYPYLVYSSSHLSYRLPIISVTLHPSTVV